MMLALNDRDEDPNIRSDTAPTEVTEVGGGYAVGLHSCFQGTHSSLNKRKYLICCRSQEWNSPEPDFSAFDLIFPQKYKLFLLNFV